MWMKSFMRSAAMVSAMALPAAADDRPVVVELYTSQGCSSCPPADALLGELAGMDGVIALALHVDYWDYIGWADVFARPDHTARQKSYARAAGQRMIYTPQMVIDGVELVSGNKPMHVAEAIQAHKARDTGVTVGLVRQGDEVIVTVESVRPIDGRAVVQLVRYHGAATVEIERGENAGRTITYHHIVTAWDEIGAFTGDARQEFVAAAPGEEAVVAIVQMEGPGVVLAAGRLD